MVCRCVWQILHDNLISGCHMIHVDSSKLIKAMVFIHDGVLLHIPNSIWNSLHLCIYNDYIFWKNVNMDMLMLSGMQVKVATELVIATHFLAIDPLLIRLLI